MTIVDNNDSYPAGAVMWFASTTAIPGWFLLDGSIFDETANPQLYALLGENVLPDFNGVFVNGTHTQTDIDGFTLHNDTTRTPRNTAFKTSTTGNHRHTDLTNFDDRYNNDPDHGVNPSDQTDWDTVAHAGNHTHTISGGDAETAPPHVYLALFVKGG